MDAQHPLTGIKKKTFIPKLSTELCLLSGSITASEVKSTEYLHEQAEKI